MNQDDQHTATLLQVGNDVHCYWTGETMPFMILENQTVEQVLKNLRDLRKHIKI